jgi:cyclic dehypoxanthinyl futalosine synthase
MARPINDILDAAISGRRLTADEGLALLESHNLAALGRAADVVTRRLHPEPFRTYNIDRNINYTNVCTSGCRFCAFSRKIGDPDAYVLTTDELHRKIDETIALGGNQILLQGGLHPELKIDWYENLLRDIKRHYPQINIHGFSPPEIDHIAALSGLSVRETLVRLKAAGLGSLPGGGAEILVDRVRRQVSPCKTSANRWLEVCRTWHALGGRGSATMMFGHVETPANRIEHLERLRALQDETHGFTAFICWTFQPGNTPLASEKGTAPICAKHPSGRSGKWGLSPFPLKLGAFEYLKTLAVSRLFLDNFANLQASWVTQGLAVGQLALHFGANDFGSLMIEENVVAAAGTSFRTSESEIRRKIAEAGYPPRRRNGFYEIMEENPATAN